MISPAVLETDEPKTNPAHLAVRHTPAFHRLPHECESHTFTLTRCFSTNWSHVKPTLLCTNHIDEAQTVTFLSNTNELHRHSRTQFSPDEEFSVRMEVQHVGEEITYSFFIDTEPPPLLHVVHLLQD